MRFAHLLLLSVALPNASWAGRLTLLEGDPGNRTRIEISVRVRDSFTSLDPFLETIYLRDGGSGSLEFGTTGIIEQRILVNRFEFSFAGGNTFETTIGTLAGDIPMTLTLDEAGFAYSDSTGEIQAAAVVGTSSGIAADMRDASAKGSVTLGAAIFPFDLYPGITSCSGSRGCVDNAGVYIDSIASFEVSNSSSRDSDFFVNLPATDLDAITLILGEVDGLTVSMRFRPAVGGMTFVPEPSTALLLAFGLVGLVVAGRRLR